MRYYLAFRAWPVFVPFPLKASLSPPLYLCLFVFALTAPVHSELTGQGGSRWVPSFRGCAWGVSPMSEKLSESYKKKIGN